MRRLAGTHRLRLAGCRRSLARTKSTRPETTPLSATKGHTLRQIFMLFVAPHVPHSILCCSVANEPSHAQGCRRGSLRVPQTPPVRGVAHTRASPWAWPSQPMTRIGSSPAMTCPKSRGIGRRARGEVTRARSRLARGIRGGGTLHSRNNCAFDGLSSAQRFESREPFAQLQASSSSSVVRCQPSLHFEVAHDRFVPHGFAFPCTGVDPRRVLLELRNACE